MKAADARSHGRSPWWLPRDPVVAARTAGILSLAGVGYELLTHTVDPTALRGDDAAWVVLFAGCGLLAVAALPTVLLPARVPRWSSAALALLATVVVCALGITSADVSFDAQVAMGWTSLYAAYHLNRRGAWTVTLLALAADVALLAHVAPVPQTLHESLAFAATFVVTTWLLSSARDRSAARLERVQTLAERDALTGLASRRVLEDRMAHAVDTGRACALLLVDVDHFKAVNDGDGHQVGDLVLTAVAAVLQRCSRALDVAARYGGDELAVLLLDADLDVAATVAERVREEVEVLLVPRSDLAPTGSRQHVHVTVSIGVAARPGSAGGLSNGGLSNGSVRDLVASADQALYAAKRAGRNRVARAGHVLDAATPAPAPHEVR